MIMMMMMYVITKLHMKIPFTCILNTNISCFILKKKK